MRAGEHGHGAGSDAADLSGLEKTGARREASGHVLGRDAAGLDVAGVPQAAQLAF